MGSRTGNAGGKGPNGKKTDVSSLTNDQSNRELPAADEHEAVAAGRDALGRWWDSYPWYDADADTLRPVDVAQETESSGSWDWLLDWQWDWSWFQGIQDFFTMPDDVWGWIHRILIIVIFAAVIYLFYRVAKHFRGHEPLDDTAEAEPDHTDSRTTADRVEALPFSVESCEDLLGAADHYRRKQDYGKAIVYLFSHLLVQLDQRGAIRLSKGKTNRQYLRELGRHAPVWELTHRTMTAFEDAFFGNHTLDRTRFEACWIPVTNLAVRAGEGHA